MIYISLLVVLVSISVCSFTDDAQTIVECQHGEEECYGNKILACSMDQLKDQMKAVKYDRCVLMNNSDDDAATESKPENVSYRNEDIQDVEKETVKLQVYYECLCPDCMGFYSSTLFRTMSRLTSSIELHTYPFGNANFTDDARTKVVCQHGEIECYGNKILACSIDQLKHEDQMKYVNYTSCVVREASDDAAATDCGKDQGVDYQSILKCAKGQKGQDLLIYYGKETYKVRPAQKYTPYVLINGKLWNEDDDFEKAVCEAFKNPPEACKQ